MIQIDPFEKRMLVIDEGSSMFSRSPSKEKIELIAKFHGISKENIFTDYESWNNAFPIKELEIPERRTTESEFRKFIESLDGGYPSPKKMDELINELKKRSFFF